jgi:hypothetical protein
MKFLFLSILLLFPIFKQENCEFPSSLKNFLKLSKLDLTLVNSSEIIKDWKVFLPDVICPTLVKCDLNGDQKDDYCAIVHNGKLIQLVVFEQTKTSFQIAFSEEITFGQYDSGYGWAISKVSPGWIYGIDDSLNLKSNGIEFTKFESSTKVLYKKGNKYEQIWTGD